LLVIPTVFDAQGLSYAFVEHSNGDLVVALEDGRPIRFKPKQLGCYVIHVNRRPNEGWQRKGLIIRLSQVRVIVGPPFIVKI
jgi:hypothetical protein